MIAQAMDAKVIPQSVPLPLKPTVGELIAVQTVGWPFATLATLFVVSWRNAGQL